MKQQRLVSRTIVKNYRTDKTHQPDLIDDLTVIKYYSAKAGAVKEKAGDAHYADIAGEGERQLHALVKP